MNRKKWKIHIQYPRMRENVIEECIDIRHKKTVLQEESLIVALRRQ